MTQELLDDAIITELDISHLVIEDDTPVDNFQSAQQQRLLVESLYSSKALPLPFVAEANVGLFYKLEGDPIVPDVLLSLGVQRAEDFSDRRNCSYLVWEFGKVPEACIEIVSKLTPPHGISEVGRPTWLNGIGIGLTLWEGQFEEDVTRLWLRWCDRNGQVISTGAERADRLTERLRALGLNPDEV